MKRVHYQQHSTSGLYKRSKLDDEDRYFEDDDDGYHRTVSSSSKNEEIDPLDAFMMNLEKQETNQSRPTEKEILETEDHALDAYMEGVNNPDVNTAILRAVRQSGYDSDEEVYATAKAIDQHERNIVEKKSKKKLVLDYDSDDNPVLANKKYSRTLVLEPVKHDEIEYEEFQRNLYVESDQVKNLTDEQVNKIRQQLEISISGVNPVKPVTSISQMSLHPALEAQIKFEKPTPIQAQAVPAILSGRDVLGSAKTGSGKTFAYLWPMIMHLMSQPATAEPHAMILAPTRELCQQIFNEAKKLCNKFELRIVPLFGGVEKKDQFKELKKGCDVIICTPGRLIDIYQQKGLKLDHITFVVLDEADQMFNMGFESQVRSIMQQIRPDRQTVMFSATFDARIENLAHVLLTDALRIRIGSTHNSDILQRVIILPRNEKLNWLLRFLQSKRQSVLIFCNGREACDDLARKINEKGITSMSIHGDMTQEERSDVLNAFRNAIVSVLIATDIASRGLDVPELNYVINYDIAKDVESHVHRVGRTGRAGSKGEAYTLVGSDEIHGAPIVVRALETSNQVVPVDLMNLAQKNPKFQTERKFMSQQGFTSNRFQTVGIGYNDRQSAISSLQQSRAKSLSQQHLKNFVKPQNEDTVLQPEKKKFVVIPAKNPQPLAPKKIEIVPAKNAAQPTPANKPVIQANMTTQQQQLIYQQYQEYLAKK